MKPLVLPIRTVNALNTREHWSKRAKRAKQERAYVYVACGQHWVVNGWPELPCTVLLTRIAYRRMDDDGNVASFKAIRDAIAERLGVDDGSAQITFKYAQRRGKPKEYAIEISIL